MTILSLGRVQAGPDLELVALFPVFCHSLVPPPQPNVPSPNLACCLPHGWQPSLGRPQGLPEFTPELPGVPVDCLQKGLNLDWNTVPGGRVGLSTHTVCLSSESLSGHCTYLRNPAVPHSGASRVLAPGLKDRKGERGRPQGCSLSSDSSSATSPAA